MTAELGQINDPKELVPGNVGSVAGTMWAMRSYGDSLHEAGVGLRRVDTHEGWSGKAADNFREAFHGQPGKWLEAGDCFHDAATALDSYDSTLRWAQLKAGEAIRLWNEGDAATAQAKVEHAHAVQQAQDKAAAKTAAGTPTTAPNIPFSDPGEAKRKAARQTLDRARRQLSSAGAPLAMIRYRLFGSTVAVRTEAVSERPGRRPTG